MLDGNLTSCLSACPGIRVRADPDIPDPRALAIRPSLAAFLVRLRGCHPVSSGGMIVAAHDYVAGDRDRCPAAA